MIIRSSGVSGLSGSLSVISLTSMNGFTDMQTGFFMDRFHVNAQRIFWMIFYPMFFIDGCFDIIPIFIQNTYVCRLGRQKTTTQHPDFMGNNDGKRNFGVSKLSHICIAVCDVVRYSRYSFTQYRV